MESGDEEKSLFAAVTQKHQIEADRYWGHWRCSSSHNVAGCPPVFCSVFVSGVHCPSFERPLPTQGGKGKCADSNIHATAVI